MNATALLWDRDEAPPAGSGETYLWRSHAGEPELSVPRRLETHAARLRSRYLAFVHDLGETRVSGRSVVEHLALNDGFSLWWMTLVAEKSPFKSPRLYDCLRLLALEEMLRERRPAELLVESGDPRLARAAAALCADLKIPFRRGTTPQKAPTGRSAGPRRLIPMPVQGLLSFALQAVRASAFRGLKKPAWFADDRAVFFCSYFAHLDAETCARGVFRSRQWGTLPERLRDSGRRSNWIHLFIRGSQVPDARAGIGWLNLFNAEPDARGVHSFLDCFLTAPVLIRAIGIWVGLCAAAWRLRGFGSSWGPERASWLSPFLRDDWNVSLTGPTAANNCLWVELFDAALKDVPPQKSGLYLCENQGWERAFLRAWRRHGHGRIIGAAHSTVPFWHLYYLDDPRTLRSTQPLPDLLAVNGPAARAILLEAGFPAEKLVDVEAVRYLGLPRPESKRAIDPERARVLVLGDIDPASMRGLLTMLSRSVGLIPAGWTVTIKPHPVCPVRLAEYPGLERAGQTNAPLDEILGDFDLALAANGTSAAVDAEQAGLPVVVALEGASLNLSPLRGRAGARFAGTPEELAGELTAAARSGRRSEEGEDFFFLDPELPRWSRLLL